MMNFYDDIEYSPADEILFGLFLRFFLKIQRTPLVAAEKPVDNFKVTKFGASNNVGTEVFPYPSPSQSIIQNQNFRINYIKGKQIFFFTVHFSSSS